MATIIDLVYVFLVAIGLNLIPFAGPSNLLIASNSALILPDCDVGTLVMLGFLIAFGAALAKSVHYLVTFFVSKHLSEKRRQRLDIEAEKVKKWAFLLLYAAAASPIPDEPIVIPLGLMKYSPPKFFGAYFLGKLTITIAGVFFGAWTKSTFSEFIDPNLAIAISIILTIIITVIMLKVDFGKLSKRIFKRNHPAPSPEKNKETTTQ
jgi:membrane protein YqaA with SNARE-associated domain